MFDKGWEVMRVSFEVCLLIDPSPEDLALYILEVLVDWLLQGLGQGPHSQEVDLATLILLVDLAQVFLLQLDHPALDAAVVFGEPGGGVGGGVGAGVVDEGVALGQVAVGVLQVVAHFTIKINVIRSILNPVGPLKSVFELIAAEPAVVIFIHGVDELDDL